MSPENDLVSLVRALPKAELHLHIEGTLEPEMVLALSTRNGVPLPYDSAEELRRAYVFEDLQSFLDLYYTACAVLVEEEDFADLTFAYMERCRTQNIRHAEIFFDPQTHTQRGIALGTVISGLKRGLQDGRERFGISSSLIMCFLRDLDAQAAMSTFEEAEAFIGDLVAVGLDSAEVGNPPSKFEDVFAKARDLGLKAVAHAGEEGPASYITDALEALGVSRIDHGIRCTEDDSVVERLRRDRIPLTVCPLSNVKLRVFKRLEEHNVLELLHNGLCVTVNSDDPAYFGGYVEENYLALVHNLGATASDLVRLARNSFEASFMDETSKKKFLREVDSVARSHAIGI